MKALLVFAGIGIALYWYSNRVAAAQSANLTPEQIANAQAVRQQIKDAIHSGFKGKSDADKTEGASGG